MNRRIIFSVCLAAGVLMGSAMLGAQEKPASNVTSMRAVVEKSILELWRSNIKPPAGKEDSAGLAEAVRRLTSVRFRTKADLFAEAEDSTSKPSLHPTSQPAAATTQPERIGPEILEKLKKLPPGSISDPSALADTLFLGGYLESSAFFYEMALENEMDADERAWQLFQAGNCYRKLNPPLAVKTYGKLLTEHPNSIWCSAAFMPSRIIAWRKENNLDGLMAELRKQTKRESRPVPVIRETNK